MEGVVGNTDKCESNIAVVISRKSLRSLVPLEICKVTWDLTEHELYANLSAGLLTDTCWGIALLRLLHPEREVSAIEQAIVNVVEQVNNTRRGLDARIEAKSEFARVSVAVFWEVYRTTSASRDRRNGETLAYEDHPS